MSYYPPGVTVEQIQKTNSPTLTEPDLSPALVGPVYKVVNISSTSTPYTAHTNVSQTVTLSGLDLSTAKLDNKSVYVDLVMPVSAAGPTTVAANSRKIIASGLTFGTNSVTFPAQGLDWSGAQVYVGWRALRKDLRAAYQYTSLEEVSNDYDGNFSSFNPLGFAAKQAISNGNSSIWLYGTGVDEFNNLVASGIDAAGEHANALEAFGTKEVYTLVPLTSAKSIITTYGVHANTFSSLNQKRERIVVGAPRIPWSSTVTPAANKSVTATTTAVQAAGTQEKRTVYVFPDVAFATEVRHVSTLKPAYIADLYNTGTSFSTAVNAVLGQQITFATTNTEATWAGKVAVAGDEIDSSLWNALVSHVSSTNNPWYSAEVPLPASVSLASAVSGQIAGNPPQQGLTNMAIAGVSTIKFCSDWFTEAQLNIIAEGGNYIIRQPKAGATISSRHQLSTDMSSVEKREISITKTVDYVAKFLRTTVSPFIGKYVINDLSLTMIRMAILGVGDFLKRRGIVNGFTLNKLAQDTVDKSQVLVDVTIQPPYPVNKITIQLIF